MINVVAIYYACATYGETNPYPGSYWFLPSTTIPLPPIPMPETPSIDEGFPMTNKRDKTDLDICKDLIGDLSINVQRLRNDVENKDAMISELVVERDAAVREADRIHLVLTEYRKQLVLRSEETKSLSDAGLYLSCLGALDECERRM